VEKCCRAGQATDDVIIRRMCIACWITRLQTEYVIIMAFPLQQWLHERASMLRYMSVASPVNCLTVAVFLGSHESFVLRLCFMAAVGQEENQVYMIL